MDNMPHSFRPWDPDTLPHLPGSAAVNPSRGAAAWLGRVGLTSDEGAARLLDDLGCTCTPIDLEFLPVGLHGRRCPVTIRATVDVEVDAAVEALDVVEVSTTVGDLTVVHRGVIPRARVRRLGLFLALVWVAAMLGLLPGTAQTAAAAGPVKGPGLELVAEGRHVHEGAYRFGGDLLYCIDWGKALGDGPVTTGSIPARVPAETRARLAMVVTMWGQTASVHQAADVKLALDTIAAAPGSRLAKAVPGMLRQVTAADRANVARMVEASKTHAPYRLSRSLAGAVPGQRGSLAVRVVGSNGKPAAGLAVAWTLTGGTAVSGPRVTGADGRAVLVFTATGLGQHAEVDVAAPGLKVRINTPTSSARQTMIGAAPFEHLHAGDVAEVCPVQAEHRTTCPCQHTGDREITVRWSAADLTGWYRGTVSVDGVEVAHVDLGAGESGDTTIHVQPGQDVTVGYAIYGTSARTGGVLYSDTLDEWTQR